MDTLTSIRDTIVRGETTARAATTSALNAAEKLNDTLNAFLEIDREGALRRGHRLPEVQIFRRGVGIHNCEDQPGCWQEVALFFA